MSAASESGFEPATGGRARDRDASAADESLLFVEWEADVPTPSGAYALGLVDRFDLVCGRILTARTFFDAAALARALRSPSGPG